MSAPPAPDYPLKLRRLYAPFLGLAEHCRDVVGTVVDSFEVGERYYTIPRFTFLGAPGSGPQQRIGLFSLIHGDEPAGSHALLRLLCTVADQPALATGYDLVLYPVCNPTGYEDGTRTNRAGFDLNREFWHESSQPEVRILETELSAQNFDGIIALHADDTSDGLYGYAHNQLLNENLLVPALRASEAVLPRNRGTSIDGFPAREGIVRDCFQGILASPPHQRPRPFEIIFETPALAMLEQQVEAAAVALETILTVYRGFIAYAANL